MAFSTIHNPVRDHYRKEDKPSCGGRSPESLSKRTIDITEYRNTKRRCESSEKIERLVAFIHDWCDPLLHSGFVSTNPNTEFTDLLSRPEAAQLGVSIPNCLAYSAFNRCQPPNFMASGPNHAGRWEFR